MFFLLDLILGSHKQTSMLPLFANQRRAYPQYVRRLLNYRQMDFEYTMWQMFTACINPSKLYGAFFFSASGLNVALFQVPNDSVAQT